MGDNNRVGASAAERNRVAALALGALGVVYGDIGTSPLYAFRECFSGRSGMPVNADNVLGVLSLILWSLIIVVTIKYLLYVMRADNRGEGGILALTALVSPRPLWQGRAHAFLIGLGIFGAALLYGDGMITPAISVLSAVEGLKVATPFFDPYVIPIAIAILIALFSFQRRGTGAIGAIFGPVTLVWFACMAVLGLGWLVQSPKVLAAVNPAHAFGFFLRNGSGGFFVLGAVFLVVTGGEALYADMGHFGKQPIRLAWFAVVLPSLLINYFGQGALLLANPEAVENPFYLMAPSWSLYPLVILATAATVIASQAVISGAFSLTRQALYLGYSPRVQVHHSSEEAIGQVYVPLVNWVLLGSTVALVLGFRSSSNLAGAYGVAVSTTMVITTILAYVCSRTRWGWGALAAAVVAGSFLLVDLAFFGANLRKVGEGGWVPLLVAAFAYLLMTTWKRGRRLLSRRLLRDRIAMADFLEDLQKHRLHRVPGTAVFMVGNGRGVPGTMLHNIKHNKALHERVVLLTIVVDEVPRVRHTDRLEIQEYQPDFIRLIAHYGFLEKPNVPKILKLAKAHDIDVDPKEATFFLGRETLIISGRGKMSRWRKRLFRLMSRNALLPTQHFGIPADRVVEIGQQITL
ncbi:MAG: potassium transporter Kup [Acidobacteriota bacterium]